MPRIVCTTKVKNTPQAHGHIVSVGVGDDPDRYTSKVSVSTVRTEIVAGIRYYTQSPTTGTQADVEPYDCACGVKTIRTNPDHLINDNLDELRPCRAATK